MGAYQITYIVLLGISLLVSAYEHGRPRTGKCNFFTGLVGKGILFYILFAGGFFK